jgi:hypothetical protein
VKRAVACLLEAAHELAQVGFQLDRHAALHVALEQEQEPETSNGEREDDGGGSRRKQANSERAAPHAAARASTM